MWKLDYKESWAQKNWCFWTVVLEKTLESPLDCKKIQTVHPKGDQSWVFIGRTDAEAETPIFWPPHAKHWLIWKDPDVGKDWRQEEKGMTEDEMVGWHHRLNGHEFGCSPGVGDGQGGLACCGSWGHKESDTTEWLNWTESFSFGKGKGNGRDRGPPRNWQEQPISPHMQGRKEWTHPCGVGSHGPRHPGNATLEQAPGTSRDPHLLRTWLRVFPTAQPQTEASWSGTPAAGTSDSVDSIAGLVASTPIAHRPHPYCPQLPFTQVMTKFDFPHQVAL